MLNRATLFTEYPRCSRLQEESLVVVCPNPKCQRQIKEPVLLTIHSVTPKKQYNACPYCFAKIEPEPLIDQKAALEPSVVHTAAPESVIKQEEALETKEPEELENPEKETSDDPSGNNVLEKVNDSGPSFLKKFKALIPGSNGLKKEKKQQTEEPEPEVEAEPSIKNENAPRIEQQTEHAAKKTKPKPAPSVSKEDLKKGCPETFGYLANRPKDVSIPQVCLVCPKMVDCMLSPRDD